MDDYLINGETLENIADKIREKAPDAYEGNTVTPEEMPDAVDEVWQAGYNEGSKSVDLSSYQTKHDENLKTESKEIVDAINEVNKTANNAKNTLQQMIDGDVPVSEAIRADKLAYEEVTLKTKNKTTLGAINELNDKTVDKVKSIDTWAGGVSELYTDDGISWRERYAFNNAPELAGDDISNGDIFHRIPIVAGNGIEFENDGQLITINATGGGNYVSKYTVELTGSENVVDIINKLTTTYPDYQLGVWGLIEFTGATSGLYGLTINHYGGNTYNISGMDFATCYSMANNVKDWAQVSVWAFSGYFQPPIPYCDDSNNGQVLKVVNGVPTWVTP